MEGGVKGSEGGLMEEEIFGPVLPIIPVDSVEDAVAFINARPCPLALYVCTNSRSTFKKVTRETISGHVTWNDFSFVPIARSLPFGGVGDSGWGSYHGFDGFKTFSHEKAILEMPFFIEPLLNIRYYRANATIQKVIRLAMCAPVPYARPSSVESERMKRVVSWWRNRILTILVLIFGVWAVRYMNWMGRV